MMDTRRDFLRKVGIVGGMLVLGPTALAKPMPVRKKVGKFRVTVYRALNGKPDQNLIKVVQMLGGIEDIIGQDDVVVIKPNVQWWNQGAPNISVIKTFIDMIMDRPGGFKGEVVIAENCHRGLEPWKSAGWVTPFSRNLDLSSIRNYNDLCHRLKSKYGNKFSPYHWIRVGFGAKRVYGPADGDGYVYCDGTGKVPLFSCDNGLTGEDYRATIMTYPIFTSDKGTVIDFKNGIWSKGSYTGQPLRFINFAALNHHSTYCGATSAIKNYLGISDLSGGADPFDKGKLTEKYYNFHSFPFNKWAPGPVPGMLGAEIAVFMNTIRKADLNITTAEWVGLASRTEPPVAHTKAVLTSTDPVSLDYHAAKYILYPNSRCRIHNPDDGKSPLQQYLAKCSKIGGGIFDERYVQIKSYDYRARRLQRDDQLVVIGEKEWGWQPKMWAKYLALRMM